MRFELQQILSSDMHLGCFGDFRVGDSVCREFCVLNIRCAIEKEQNSKIELMDDLFYYEGMTEKIQ